MNLIYDRTQDDLTQIKALQELGYQNLSDADKALWDSGQLKGKYDYRDFNRVEQACADISVRLRQYGISAPVETKTDWASSDYLYQADLDRIRSNLVTLRGALTVLPDTPTVPLTLSKRTIQVANDMEKILFDVSDSLDRTVDYQRSGTFVAGQYFAPITLRAKKLIRLSTGQLLWDGGVVTEKEEPYYGNN